MGISRSTHLRVDYEGMQEENEKKSERLVGDTNHIPASSDSEWKFPPNPTYMLPYYLMDTHYNAWRHGAGSISKAGGMRWDVKSFLGNG